jgi:hypothetical protein
MLYRAARRPDGAISVTEVDDALFGGREGAAERWSQQNVKVVNNDVEQSKAFEDGWRKKPDEAIEFLKSREQVPADEAAHGNYLDRNMSEKALAEKAAKEAAAEGHLPEIKEEPIRRRTAKATTESELIAVPAG